MQKFSSEALLDLRKVEISDEATDNDKNQFSETTNQYDVKQLSEQQIGTGNTIAGKFHFINKHLSINLFCYKLVTSSKFNLKKKSTHTHI